jgi:hypothetical protein
MAGFNPKKARKVVESAPVELPEGFAAIYREDARGMGVGGVYYEAVSPGLVYIPVEFVAICVEAHGFEAV